MFKGFRDFIVRGNVVDLAVAFVLGLAFVTLVTATLNGLINPLIAAIFGQPNLDSVGTFTINDAEFSIGVVLTAAINFVIIAAVLYFLVVLPMNTLTERMRRNKPVTEPEKSDEVLLLIEIRDALRQRN